MNSITKEYENFSRKVIEHARGSNDRFETGLLLLLLVWCGQNFVPFAPQTTAHLLLRRFAFFLESPFCPWMPRDASCFGPSTSRRQPTRRRSCSDSTKNLLVQYVIAALMYCHSSAHNLGLLSRNSCGGEELCTDLMIHRGTAAAEWAEHSTGQIFSP